MRPVKILINIFTGLDRVLSKAPEKDFSVVRPGIELVSPGQEADAEMLPLSCRCYDNEETKTRLYISNQSLKMTKIKMKHSEAPSRPSADMR